MKNIKRVVMSLLVLTVVISAVVWYRADAVEPNTLLTTPSEDVTEADIQTGVDDGMAIDMQFVERYEAIRGKVLSVTQLENDNSVVALDEEGNRVENAFAKRYHVRLETDDKGTVDFVVTNDTIFTNDTEITEGAIVTGFYDFNLPVPAIYPPQYRAVVMAVGIGEAESVFVGRFDENLVSTDNRLKLNISDETEIVYEDGAIFSNTNKAEQKTESLANMKLIVLYTVSTRSIPAQTTPSKIIVPYSNVIMPLAEQDNEEANIDYSINELLSDIETYPIFVEDKELSGVSAYIKNETVMLPLRAISEALGYELSWDAATKSVLVGEAASLTIGKDSYKLGVAPEIADGKTYVPISFFRDVLLVNNAYVYEGQIIIDNQEQMK